MAFKITTSTGFARPATFLVSAAKNFESKIFLEYKKSCINLKQKPSHSLRDIMLLGVTPGAEIILSADGIDEYEAIQFIEELLYNQNLIGD